MSCKDLAGTQPLPSGTVSPGIVQNAKGAATLAATAQIAFQTAFAAYIPVSGELTDEVQSNGRDDAFGSNGAPAYPYSDIQVDARLLDQSSAWSETSYTPASDQIYNALQYFRGIASEAIGDLAQYAPDSLKATRGLLYALQGYAEVMLADLFCSGVPLSTLDYRGDYTYRPGSSTAAVYTHAIALFDTAMVLAADSAPVVNLARVGQGRAYLALGEYAAAGQAVSSVPSTYQMADSILTCGSSGNTCPVVVSGSITTLTSFPFGGTLLAEFNFAGSNSSSHVLSQNFGFTVSDTEGGTGLPFISSHDPRTADTVIGKSILGRYQQYFPSKYHVTGVNAFVLASGLEAQLITAEAALNAGNATGMFTILNALRENNTATVGLPTLTDPGTFGAEVDTLFTERAAWLFVDGHRQGDLRRLTRNYVKGQGIPVVANQYPGGTYPGVGLYGSFIDAPIPSTELANPNFTGCLSRD